MTEPKPQASLFSDAAAPAPASSKDLSLQIKAPKLAPAQLRFNKLIEKIEQLTKKLAQTQTLADTFRPLYSSALQPLRAQYTAAVRDMVLWLDARVQQKGLTPAMLRDIRVMVCNLSEPLALAGDEGMRALYDRHSPQSLSDKEKSAVSDIQDMVQRMTGVDVSDLDEGGSVEDLLHASMQRLKQQVLDERAEKKAKAQARRDSRPRSAAQKKAQGQQQDAQGALRTIYRQLASALHPDREPDALERVRKTELMGQVNAAYERRDLMALLTLQLSCEQIDASAISRLSAEKMAALTLLLKEQATALEKDVHLEVSKVQQEFDLSPFTLVTTLGLTLDLDAQTNDLMQVLAEMQDDLRSVQTDAGLKHWVKTQKKMLKAQELESGFSDFFR
ncbi:MAG: hypothetical protein EAZ34_03330 [Polaromonas sp.]|nr:MAG: hypothetical protein EAZ34_03330 [Polaromonas sp.]